MTGNPTAVIDIDVAASAAYHQSGSHIEFEWLCYDLYIRPRGQIRKVRHVQHGQQLLADLHSIAYKHQIKDLWISWTIRDGHEMTSSSSFAMRGCHLSDLIYTGDKVFGVIRTHFVFK